MQLWDHAVTTPIELPGIHDATRSRLQPHHERKTRIVAPYKRYNITVDGSYVSEAAQAEAEAKGLPMQLSCSVAWGLVATGAMNTKEPDDDDLVECFGGTLPPALGSKPHTSSL